MSIFSKKVIRNTEFEPYLVRYALNTPLFGIKLHHILRSDEERDLHDHPWSFLSIILAGGYREITPRAGQPRGKVEKVTFLGRSREMTWRWYGPGSILWRPAPWLHRLDLPPDTTAWTLVITGPRRREWGFHTVCGWIPWPRYAQAKQEGC